MLTHDLLRAFNLRLQGTLCPASCWECDRNRYRRHPGSSVPWFPVALKRRGALGCEEMQENRQLAVPLVLSWRHSCVPKSPQGGPLCA